VAERLELPAPAKLNLFLHVTGRRPDGYHELQTVFQLLDWGDCVRLERTTAQDIRRGAEIDGVDVQSDLSLEAARRLQEEARATGRPWGGAVVTVDKQIPQGSGMGGASSDAATVLLGLNALWACGFDEDALAGIGRSLGADVPVFVRGRSAWAEGIGDKLTPLPLGPRWYVLVFPEEGADTAALFADPTLRRDAPRLEAGARNDLCALGNDFLPVLLRRCPGIADTYRSLGEFGTPRLTGSGSTLFLEAPDEAAATRLTSTLKNHYNVRAVRGTDRSPVLDALTRNG
jgi:4-diphosphocytidyl-2-C-methyl-D-erythritol kinase